MRSRILSLSFIFSFVLGQNYSLSFDGVDDYVSIPDNDALDIGSSDFSIQFWIKSNDNNKATIVSKSEGGNPVNTWYFVNMNSNGTIEYEITDGYSGSGDYSTATGSIAVNDGEWHHISVLFDRDNLGYIYIDGILDVSSSIASHPGNLSNNASLEFGVDLDHSQHYTSGNIDEVYIWNTVLTQEEIQSYMTTSPIGTESGLVGYWNFNESEGTTLTDQTSNGNNGTIVGATWSTDVPPTPQTPCSPPVYTETECYYNGGWWDWNSMQCYDCSGGGGGGGNNCPLTLTVSTPTTGSTYDYPSIININWSSTSSSGSDYYVYIKLYKGGSFQSNQFVDNVFWSNASGGTLDWYFPNNIETGSDYSIRVECTENNQLYGESGYFTINALDVTAPSTPTNLTATPGDGEVVLNWTANSESDLASYRVYGAPYSSPNDLIATITAGTETYTHSNLTNENTYYYRISAVDDSDNESDKTSDVSAVPVADYSSGVTLHVSTSGSDSNDGSSSSPYATIQAGINAATNADTVLVQAGTYTENLTFQSDKSITIASLYETTGDTSYISTTIINGNDAAGPVVYMNSASAALRLIGLTVTNGSYNEDLSNPGGGLHISNSDSLLIDHVLIKNNTTENWSSSGGVYINNLNYVKIINTTITNNTSADDGGGGLNVYDCDEFEMVNTLIAENTANGYGAGVYISNNDEVQVVNSTIANNKNDCGGCTSGFYISSATTDSVLIMNSIISQNYYYDENDDEYKVADSQVDFSEGKVVMLNNYTSSVIYNESYIKRSVGNVFSSTSPFTDAVNGDFSLSPFSGAIGSGIASASYDGNTVVAPTTDMNGISRPNPSGSTADIGALESSYANKLTMIYVTTSGDDDNQGTEAAPFGTVQHAIDVAASGDTVLVAPGTYTENLAIERALSVTIASQYLTTGDTSYISTTIVNGNGAAPVLYMSSSSASLRLVGLTLTNGGYDEDFTNAGGGLHASNSDSLFVDHVVIKNNATEGYGSSGGAYINNLNYVKVINTTIADNTCPDNGGGGLNVESCNEFELVNTLIEENTGNGYGAGVYISNNDEVQVVNSTIANNKNDCGGCTSGFYISSATTDSVLIMNSIISQNYLYDDNADEYRVAGSQMGFDGGKVVMLSNYTSSSFHTGESRIKRSIGNVFSSSSPFTNAANGDYSLSPFSGAIGSGIVSASYDGNTIVAPTTDLLSVSRPTPAGSTPDMGALESSYANKLTMIYVATTGSDANQGTEAAPFLKVQHAIDIAGSGDTVLVAPGTYTENLAIERALSVTIASQYLTTSDTSYISSTILHGGGAGPTIYMNTWDNWAENYGRASLFLIGVTVTGGAADEDISLPCFPCTAGGGLYAYTIDSLVFDHVNVMSNTTAGEGSTGGIGIGGDSPVNSYVKIANSTISNNTANDYNIIFNVNNTKKFELINSIVHSNTGTGYGIGLNVTADTVLVLNSTIANNKNYNDGFTDGLYINMDNNSDSVLVMNSIISQNQFWDYFTNDFVVGDNHQMGISTGSLILINNYTNEDLHQGQNNIKRESGNVYSTANPFTDMDNGDLSLSDISDAIGAGTSSNSYNGVTINAPVTDINGNSRPSPAGSTPDIGAIENARSIRAAKTITVNQDGTGDFSEIQTAIDAVMDGDTVLVSPGTYYENINYNGKNIVVGSLYMTTQDLSYISSTIIDGSNNTLQNGGSVVCFVNEETDQAVLMGFTIQNGTGYRLGNEPNNDGSYSYGGGIYCYNSSPSLSHLRIINNTVNTSGGGISLNQASPAMENIITASNYASDNGSGIYAYWSSPTINNILISNNKNSNTVVFASGGSNITINHLTSFGNENISIFGEAGEIINIKNSILWDDGAPIIEWDSGQCSITYSNIQGGYDGEGNIDADPLFVDAANGDYRLSGHSPAIGAGTATGAPTTDIAGNPRPSPAGSTPDMGAYENAQPNRRPLAGTITDGLGADVDWGNSTSTLSAAWDEFSDNSAVTYEYAVGIGEADASGENYSLEFDGNSAQVDLPSSLLAGVNQFTFETWFYPAGHQYGFSNIVHQEDGPYRFVIFYYETASLFEIDFTINNYSQFLALDIPSPNQWHHIAFAYNGSTATAYLDGEQVGSFSISGSYNSNSNIGIGNWAYQEGFNGNIDDLSFWNTANSQSEIQDHIASGLSGDEDGLMGYWDFNDASGTTLTDQSGNNNHGSIYDATWSDNVPESGGHDDHELADVLTWTSNGADTSVTITGLTLTNGETYTVSVRATDTDSQVSDTTTTDGITIDITAPVISSVYEGSGGFTQNNYSLSFDGEFDYVSLGGSNVSKPSTAEMWVKRRDDPDHQILLNQQNSYSLRLEQWNASNKVGYSKASTYDANFNYEAPLEEWVHLAVVTTSDSVTLFVNGAYYAKNNQTNFNIPIGTIGKNGASTINATIDELRVWSVARTAAQIADNMSMELDGNETGLEAYYNMNNGTDTTLTDHSANANHGTIYGATWSTDIPTFASTEDADYQNDASELIISWSGADTSSGIATYEYALGTTAGGIETVGWTSTGTATAATLTGLSLVDGQIYYVSVRATDVAGNVSDVLTGDGITIDLTAPTGTTVNDGTEDDITYSGAESTLSANWNAFTDGASGVDNYEVSIGTSASGTDILDWTDNSTETTFTNSNLYLDNGSTYYMNVRATDAVGNVSAVISSDGVIADLEGPEVGATIDGTVSDVDWTNSTTSLSGSWAGFSDALSGIDYYEYAIGTTGGGSSGENYSLEFDGYNSRVELPAVILDDLGEFSIAAWYYANGDQNGLSNIIRHDTGPYNLSIRFDDGNNVMNYSLTINNNSQFVDISIPSLYEWHHVGFTYDGSTATAYLDGEAVGSFSMSGTYYSTSNINIGNWSNNEGFNGYIDDLSIWDTANSQSDIQSYITSGLNGDEAGLVGYWNFNDGSGNTLTDQSGNNYNGSIFDAYWSDNVPNVSGENGGTDIVDWLDVRTATSFSRSDLILENGTTYFVSSRATDDVSNVSSSAISDGITIDTDVPVVIEVIEGNAGASNGFENTVTDIDGNVYGTVQISDQVWMAENLKATRYRDGSSIPTGYNNSEWPYITTGAYAVYDNNEANADTYGYLYNWSVVADSRNIAPEGWHVPTDEEWTALTDYLGGEDVAGGKMKEAGTEHWTAPNTGATNESGFTALPGGFRGAQTGAYESMFGSCDFWTSTEFDGSRAWWRQLSYGDTEVDRGGNNKPAGFSIRCVKNASSVADGDLDYQGDPNTLVVSWFGSDDASGVATYEYALGTSAGNDDEIAWTEAGTATADTLTGLSLVEGTTYYLSVRVTDVAGNVSDELSGDGILIDQTAPILGTVIDGMGSDITYSGSDSTLVSEWTGFSDPVSGMSGYEISAGYSPGDVAIYDWTPVGNVNNYVITNIAMSHGDLCYVNIRAIDIAGNVSAPVSSNGVTIDTDPPGSIVDIEFDYYNEPGWADDLQIQGSAADGEMQSGLNYVEVSIQNQDNTTYWTGSNWDGNETWLMASGLASWTYDLSGTDLVDDNSYEIRSRGTDMVGNTQVDHGNDQFTYDISEPNTFLDIPDDYYNNEVWNSDAPIQGTADDSTSEIVAVYVMIQRDSDDLYYDGENWTASELWFTAENTDTWSYELDGSNLDDEVSYAVQVKAEDIAGNIETSPATELFTFDITLPESDVLIERDFYNNINWSDANSISGTGSDSTSGLDSMAITIKRTSDNYWWGGTSWTTGESWLAPAGLETWTYAMNGNNLTNGVSYTVSSRSRDVASNVQVDYGEDSFIYDLTSPTLGQVNDGLASTDEDWTNSTTVLTANWAGFTDITSGILKYEYSAGMTPGSTDLISWTDAGLDTTFSEDVTMTSGTLYYISIRATDGAENVSGTVTSDGVTVDAANPVVSIINEGSTSQDMDYQQDGSALIISWDGSDGTRSFFRNGRDISGFRVTLGSSSGDSNVVDWVDVGNVTTHTFSGLDLQEAVTYYASVQAEDLAGNLSEILTGDGITIDQSGPVPGILNDGVGDDVDWVNINYLSVGAWTGFEDSLSGIAEYEYSVGLAPGQTQTVTWTSAGLDTTITVSASLTEGPTYYANVRATDNVTNVGDVISSDGFGLDVSAPITGNVYDGLVDDLSWTADSTTLTANWVGFSDVFSGIAYYEYAIGTNSGGEDVVPWTLNGDSTFVISINLALESGTTYYVSVRATDWMNNISTTGTSNGITLDTSNPVVTVPNEGGVGVDYDFQNSLSDIIISWTGSDGTRSLSNYEYAIGLTEGGTEIMLWTDNGTATDVTVTGLALTEGITYYASVRAIDMAGNVSAETTGDGITPDVTAPLTGTVMDGLQEELTYTGTLDSLSANWTGFSDNLSGILFYEFAIGVSPGDSSVIAWSNVAQDTFYVQPVSVSDAQLYFVSIRATDNVTNRSGIVSSDGVTTDTTAPVMGYVFDGTQDSEIDWTNSLESLQYTWDGFNDTVSGIAHYQFSMGTTTGGTNIIPWTMNDDSTNVQLNDLGLDNGTEYFLNVRAVDLVSNISQVSSTDGITTDTIPPGVQSIFEGEANTDWDYQSNDTSLVLGWDGNDDASGIDYYEIAYGTDPGETDIVDWSFAGIEIDTNIIGLALTEGTAYYGLVRAYDVAGNLSVVTAGDGIVVDLTPPELGTIIDGDVSDNDYTGSLTTLESMWSGFYDVLSGIQYYEYSVGTTPGDTDFKDWTVANLDTVIVDESFDLSNGQSYFVSVRSTDNVGNVSVPISTDGIIPDHEGPYGSMATDGDSADIDQQNYTDVFNGYWSEFQDDLSGLAFHSMALYDTTNASYTIPWDSIGLDTVIQLMGLNLEVNHVYQLHIRATDFVENTGAIIASDGVLIDQTAPEPPQSLVGSFSNERIYLTWDANSEPDLSHYIVYGGTDTLQLLTILQTGVSTAEAYLPDFPTDEAVYLHVTAEDIPGNESPVSNWVGGIPQPAMVTRIEPDPAITLLKDDQQISIHFSQPLSDIGSVTTTSLAYSSMGLDAAYSAEDTSIKITVNDPWASLDTVTFALNDILDWAGTGTDEKTTTYTTYLLGDYNDDFFVDVADLSSFVSAWNSEDYSYELGPVTGTVPHLIPSRNQSYDLRDMMVFTRMWHYSHATSTNRLLVYDPVGSELTIRQEGNHLIVDLPSETSAAHVYLSYPRESKTITPPVDINSDDVMQLAYHHGELGQLVVEKAFMKREGVKNTSFDLSSLDRSNALIEINYVAYGDSNRVIARGTQTFNIIAIPDQFALHQNYPNPFNPTTRINYDVPEMGHTDIRLYDLMGREVRTLLNRELAAGYHTINWDGKNNRGQIVSAGIYFCQLRARGFTKTLKMMLLK